LKPYDRVLYLNGLRKVEVLSEASALHLKSDVQLSRIRSSVSLGHEQMEIAEELLSATGPLSGVQPSVTRPRMLTRQEFSEGGNASRAVREGCGIASWKRRPIGLFSTLEFSHEAITKARPRFLRRLGMCIKQR
jgi:hypothetical protein